LHEMLLNPAGWQFTMALAHRQLAPAKIERGGNARRVAFSGGGWRYNHVMGQDGHTTRAAVLTPWQRWHADCTAWCAALANLRHNPLLTHLRPAEARRRQRIPFLRRNWLALLIFISLAILVAWIALTSKLSIVNYYQAGLLLAVPVYLIWLSQGLALAIYGALGVLGRSVKRGSLLVIDDFAAVSTLSDHDIAAGAVAALFWPVARRIAVGGLLFLALPLQKFVDFIVSQAGGGSQFSGAWPVDASLDSTSAVMLHEMIHIVPYAITAIVLSLLAALLLIMLYICLGRGLKLERTAAIAVASVVISQIAYPVVYALAIVGSWDTDDLAHAGPHAAAVIWEKSALALALALGVLWLALGLARRWPAVRELLSVFSTLVVLVAAFIVQYNLHTVIANPLMSNDPVSISAYLLPSAGLFAICGVSVLGAPVIVGFNQAFGAFGTVQPAIPQLCALALVQTGMLLVLARFTVEAVSARRRLGEPA
jgi:hypothetical protein